MKISSVFPSACFSAIALVATSFQSVQALSIKEISNTAEAITVRIDGQNPGSGVLIKRQGNQYTILTAAHVVETEDEYEVITVDGQRHELDYSQVNKFPNVDLALVEFISSKSYQVADLGDSNNIKSGEIVYISGFPIPTSAITESIWNFSPGSVTANAKRSLEDGYSLVYDNNTLSGMSGGAVLNTQGKLVGIHGRADAEQQTKQTELVYVKSGFNLGISINTFLNLVGGVNPSLGFEARTTITPHSSLSADDWFIRGSDKITQGDYTGAITDLTKAIQINPKYTSAFIKRGFALSNLGDNTSAVFEYSQAIKVDPKADLAYFNRGVIRSDRGDEAGAISDFSKAIEIDPDYLSAYNNRGTSHASLGNNKLAIADFRQALRIDPNYVFAHNNIGSIHVEIGNYQTAIDKFNRAIQIDRQYDQAYYNRGRAHMFLEKFQEAITDNNIALEYNPNNVEAYNNRGFSRYRLNDHKGAITDLNQAIRLNPNFFVAYINRGNVFRQMKSERKALIDFNQAIQIAPTSAFAFLSRGNFLKSQGNTKNAIADYVDAARLYKEEGNLKQYKKIKRAIRQLSASAK